MNPNIKKLKFPMMRKWEVRAVFKTVIWQVYEKEGGSILWTICTYSKETKKQK